MDYSKRLPSQKNWHKWTAARSHIRRVELGSLRSWWPEDSVFSMERMICSASWFIEINLSTLSKLFLFMLISIQPPQKNVLINFLSPNSCSTRETPLSLDEQWHVKPMLCLHSHHQQPLIPLATLARIGSNIGGKSCIQNHSHHMRRWVFGTVQLI